MIRSDTLPWRSELRPDIFGVLMVQPERMAGWDLAHYIKHLAENRQQTEVYEIAFWSKLFYPWAVLVMMALALPFAYIAALTAMWTQTRSVHWVQLVLITVAMA